MVDDITKTSHKMTSQMSHMKQLHKSIAQMNHTKQFMNRMMSQTRFENHGPKGFMGIQLMGMGNHTRKHDNFPGNIMNDACRCSQATQVIKESLRLVNLTEFHPRHNSK